MDFRPLHRIWLMVAAFFKCLLLFGETCFASMLCVCEAAVVDFLYFELFSHLLENMLFLC